MQTLNPVLSKNLIDAKTECLFGRAWAVLRETTAPLFGSHRDCLESCSPDDRDHMAAPGWPVCARSLARLVRLTGSRGRRHYVRLRVVRNGGASRGPPGTRPRGLLLEAARPACAISRGVADACPLPVRRKTDNADAAPSSRARRIGVRHRSNAWSDCRSSGNQLAVCDSLSGTYSQNGDSC